ncbi:MAG: DUF1080 domain-containing protein, partial [Tannerella sp.]|nr:DUF1080 domain-containing protein [Tannerella sp.]
ELAAASKYFGINTLRVYLHPINFEQDRKNFMANIERFLVICDKHGIKPGFTFFDDCHRHEGIYLTHPTEPVKGYHNGRWAAAPQDRDRDINNLKRYEPYFKEIIKKYRNDDRVLWWETFNEPNMKNEWSIAMRKAAYQYAKSAKPKQPVICCWDDSPETDIVNAHNYDNHVYNASGEWTYGVAGFDSWDRQTELNPAKGCVFTEAGARWYAPRPSNGEPVEVINWLQSRRNAGKYTPGVYLCWELMAGNSNCRWYWGTPENSPEPTVPWCGLLWPDATPVSLAEAEAVRRYVTGESQALFYDDFEKSNNTVKQDDKWTIYNAPQHSGVCNVEADVKQVGGDEAWTDYRLEGRVMLTSEQGNAGLMFRVSQPGDGNKDCKAIDDFIGYYVGFDTKKLYLGKMDKVKWKQLAEYPLEKLDCKVVPGVWNQILVEVREAEIKVWFNRMHPSSDPENGLRITYNDADVPHLNGAIGMRTFSQSAKFDNIIVMP